MNSSSTASIAAAAATEHDMRYGMAMALISVLFFGSNFIPTKKYKMGDGMYFQWVMCTAIWIVGLIVNLIRGAPEFQPYAMLGGVLWCTGNIMTVTIIQCIGMGLGLCVWGSSNLIMGWASGTFGFFGVASEHVRIAWLNYLGVLVAVVSMVMYGFVGQFKEQSGAARATPDEVDATLNANLLASGLERGSSGSADDSAESGAQGQGEGEGGSGSELINKLPKLHRKLLGLTMAVAAGCMYGINFDPPTALMDRTDEAGNHLHSQNGLDYVFSHFSGIFLASTVFFVLYAAVKRNRPFVFRSSAAILPSMLSGAMWAVADVCWFVANAELGLVVAFPIVSAGPGIVGSLWGIFMFKEIKDKKNYLMFLCAALVTFIGIAMITVAK